jgi:hypothetical protein
MLLKELPVFPVIEIVRQPAKLFRSMRLEIRAVPPENTGQADLHALFVHLQTAPIQKGLRRLVKFFVEIFGSIDVNRRTRGGGAHQREMDARVYLFKGIVFAVIVLSKNPK